MKGKNTWHEVNAYLQSHRIWKYGIWKMRMDLSVRLYHAMKMTYKVKQKTLCPQYRNKLLKVNQNAPHNIAPSPTPSDSEIFTVLWIRWSYVHHSSFKLRWHLWCCWWSIKLWHSSQHILNSFKTTSVMASCCNIYSLQEYYLPIPNVTSTKIKMTCSNKVNDIK